MPYVEEHCENSKRRTGKEFRELHEWMDDPGKTLGMDHRRVRHDLSYIPEVREKFGVEGIREFLRHISEDYLDSAEKWGSVVASDKQKKYMRALGIKFEEDITMGRASELIEQKIEENEKRNPKPKTKKNSFLFGNNPEEERMYLDLLGLP